MKDPDWDMFTRDNAIAGYKKRLLDSVTFVCFENGMFCGYVRALLDDGFAVYVSELFVAPEWRNRSIGKALLAKVRTGYKHLSVYVLSDEDAYYEKLGYKNIGSVFEIPEQTDKQLQISDD